jgi:hypothetical protein
MFTESLFNRYSRAKGQRESPKFLFICLIVTSFVIGYRHQRSGAGGTGVYTFSSDFAASQRQASNTDCQTKEKEAYEERMRDLGTFYFCICLF